MHLLSQHLGEILSVLLAPPLRGSGAEKRRATRIHVEAAVTVWPVIDAVPQAATTVLTRDLSFSGIGIIQARSAKLADRFILRLPRARFEPVIVLCSITFVRTLADSLYSVGAEFVSMVEPSEVAKLPAPATPTPAPPPAPRPAPEPK